MGKWSGKGRLLFQHVERHGICDLAFRLRITENLGSFRDGFALCQRLWKVFGICISIKSVECEILGPRID